MTTRERQTLTWCIRDCTWSLGDAARILGIVNVTPDSFSDGGHYLDVDAAVAHGQQLVQDGADILDVGGESTRPGAAPVSADAELQRVLPVIEGLAASVEVPLSIDTSKSTVAAAALAAGASIVNDISGLTFDARMPAVCQEHAAGIICMHIQGTPQTMQDAPHYDDAVTDICSWLEMRLSALQQAGISLERVVLDPGIGFGKTARHNLEILGSIARLRSLGRPVLIGHSRKRFLGKVLKKPVDERLMGTVGVSLAVAAQGADLIRVHDVAATRDALSAWQAIMGGCLCKPAADH